MWEIVQKFFIVRMVLTAQKFQYAERIILALILKNATKIVVNAIEKWFVIMVCKICHRVSKVCLKLITPHKDKTKH